MKKFTLRPCQVLSLLLAFLCLNNFAFADGPVLEKQPAQDGVDSVKTRMAFLEAVINPYVLHPGQKEQRVLGVNDTPTEHLQKAKLKKIYPWLAPFVYPEHGLPKFSAVNKWNKNIRISLGFPNDLKIASDQEQHADSDDKLKASIVSDVSVTTKNEDVVISQVRSIAPVLSDLTNLKIEYVPHEEETERDFANIRLILMPSMGGMDSLYKIDDHPYASFPYGGGLDRYFDGVVWNYVPGSVFFSPTKNNQVYGYIFPNEKNNIQMAFCYIWQDHEEGVVRSLVSECLLRALGLTNIIRTEHDSLLKERGIPENDSNKGAVKQSNVDIPDIDKRLIRLLYSPEMKSGYDLIQASNVLLNLSNSH